MANTVAQLAKQMLAAALGAAKGHEADLKDYLQARAHILADGIASIIADRVQNNITDDDVKFAYQEIADSEQTAVLAAQVTAKAAAQDAINAALSVATAAINKAVGFVLL